LQVKIDGVLYTDSANFDLDFESDSPRAFYTGRPGIDVVIDKKVFNTGSRVCGALWFERT
jgi:hypothetical protein